MNRLGNPSKGLWALLQAQQEEELPPIPMALPQDVSINDSTNAPMIPKSMTVQVKRPMGYARPAQPDESVADLFRQYGDATDRALKEQNQGVDKLEYQLDQLKQTTLPDSLDERLAGVNIAPLLAYTDSMNGTNAASGYKAPESMTERQKMILGLEDAIQKRRGDVAKSEADALKEKISLYLKDQDDPMKELMAMTRVNYMNAMANAAGQNSIERDVQKLADKVANPQDLQNSIKALEKSLGFGLDEFNEENGTVKGKKVSLPGTTIPGVGRVTFHDSNARNLQSKFARIFNVELKDRSGAAVTNPEMARMREEFNAGRFNTETELISAVKAYKAAATQELQNREAAFRPQVKERYRSRGGQLTPDFKKPQAPQTKSWGGKNYELRGDEWVEVK
jgi:hypothetical protein